MCERMWPCHHACSAPACHRLTMLVFCTMDTEQRKCQAKQDAEVLLSPADSGTLFCYPISDCKPAPDYCHEVSHRARQVAYV